MGVTPKVRLDVMDAYDFDTSFRGRRRSSRSPRTEYKKLYLDAANRSLSWSPVERVSKCHYDGDKGKATFEITFNEETELTGFMKLHLWVEADGNDDMDLFVAIKKLDAKGKWLPDSASWAHLIPAARASSASPCARWTRSIRPPRVPAVASLHEGAEAQARRDRAGRDRDLRFEQDLAPGEQLRWRSWGTTSASTGSSPSPGTPTTRAITYSHGRQVRLVSAGAVHTSEVRRRQHNISVALRRSSKALGPGRTAGAQRPPVDARSRARWQSGRPGTAHHDDQIKDCPSRG